MKLTYAVIILAFYSIQSCQTQGDGHEMNTDNHKTNRLAKESSPYLLQHQHNPVDWYPWGEEAFEKAKAENKLVIVSIGYSACHWCHVMERESFEDDSVAQFMNEHFVSIKVDREERPDVDQIYMNAVQLMTGRGGWPLNCFTMPDGRPVFGGTYFPKENWLSTLENLRKTWIEEPNRVIEYAEQLTQGVKTSELVERLDVSEFKANELDEPINIWIKEFDQKWGGPNRAPKFPIPNNYQFLLHHAKRTGKTKIAEHVYLTLDKMASGGIYDQIGGGFARYSTDVKWKVPHFEKMLYDNGQLISLYSEAYTATKNPDYRFVVYQTIDWLKREMMSDENAFYSALDADSEGEEGKFYVWTEEEMKIPLGTDYDLARKYFRMDKDGLWEHGNYILMRAENREEFADKNGLTLEQLNDKMESISKVLMEQRSKRERPGLDDKTLTSWNAILSKGLIDAYTAFNEPEFLALAKGNLEFLLTNQKNKDFRLWHSYKNGNSTVNGYLEDYCFTIEALIAMYQATFDEAWLDEAKGFADYAISHFFDESSGMFFFSSDIDPPLIARKTEINDNVVPASNSSFAKGLYDLGLIYDNKEYLDHAKQMLSNVKDQYARYPSGYSNWMELHSREAFPYYEIVIVGEDAEAKRKELNQQFIPNKIILGDTDDKSNLPLLEYKFFEGETTIFVCVNKACQMPVSEVSEAMKQIK